MHIFVITVSVKRQKVKIKGRRRLCKVAVKDEEEENEDENFQDVESDFTAAVSDFDSPVPVKTTENKRESGDEIRDILSDLSSRLEILSIEKGRRPIKNFPSSSNSVKTEKFNHQKPVEISSATSNEFSEKTTCPPIRKDYTSGRNVKNEKYEDIDDDDDDDCVVTSGQKFVQKVETKHEKVHILNDDSDDTKGPFSLSNPKFNFSLPSKIATMLYPHQREGLKWLWSLHCKGKGGILGDDMGLGKTMQVCTCIYILFSILKLEIE